MDHHPEACLHPRGHGGNLGFFSQNEGSTGGNYSAGGGRVWAIPLFYFSVCVCVCVHTCAHSVEA